MPVETPEECICGTADCGAEDKANALMTALRESSGITFPTIDFDDPSYDIPGSTGNPIYEAPAKLTNTHLTERKVDGLGTFDVLMTSFSQHLLKEYEGGRITGEQYAKAYIELTTSAMGNAVSYLLGRDQAYWQAIAAQQAAKIAEAQVITARLAVQTAKFQLVQVQYEALNVEANFALTKMRLATESINYCTAEYNLVSILPQQLALSVAQTADVTEATSGKTYQRVNIMPQQLAEVTQQVNLLVKQVTKQDLDNTVILPKQADLLTKQVSLTDYQGAHQLAETTNLLPKQVLQVTGQTALVTAQTANQTAETTNLLPQQVRNTTAQADGAVYQVANLMPKQLDQLIQAIVLVKEQAESQRAQTLETRTDGAAVAGAIGKQKALQSQQIISYQRDAEMKAAKLWSDAWITMKTIDEGLDAPTQYTNANVNTVLSNIRTLNGI